MNRTKITRPSCTPRRNDQLKENYKRTLTHKEKKTRSIDIEFNEVLSVLYILLGTLQSILFITYITCFITLFFLHFYYRDSKNLLLSFLFEYFSSQGVSQSIFWSGVRPRRCISVLLFGAKLQGPFGHSASTN